MEALSKLLFNFLTFQLKKPRREKNFTQDANEAAIINIDLWRNNVLVVVVCPPLFFHLSSLEYKLKLVVV